MADGRGWGWEMLTYADRDEGGRELVDGRTQCKLYGMYLLYWAVFTKVFLSKFSRRVHLWVHLGVQEGPEGSFEP